MPAGIVGVCLFACTLLRRCLFRSINSTVDGGAQPSTRSKKTNNSKNVSFDTGTSSSQLATRIKSRAEGRASTPFRSTENSGKVGDGKAAGKQACFWRHWVCGAELGRARFRRGHTRRAEPLQHREPVKNTRVERECGGVCLAVLFFNLNFFQR